MSEQRLAGTVRRVIHRSPESGWTIISFEPEQQLLWASTVSAVGIVEPEPMQDEVLTLVGRFEKHPKYGDQFKIDRVDGRQPPVTPEGLVAYLSSSLFSGIGPTLATRIVDLFGTDTPQVIENEPDRLAEVSGISEEKAAMIAQVWKEQAESRAAISYLCGLGITMATATKIWQKYGAKTVERVQQNPYLLAWDVTGIGFQRADQVARAMNHYADDHPNRITAAILHVLKAASNEGHVYLPAHELVTQTTELLHITDQPAVSRVLADMAEQDSESGSAVIREDDRVYLPWLHAAETGVAGRVAGLLSAETFRVNIDPQKLAEYIRQAEEEIGITFTEQQRGTVYTALMSGISVITGGPGTGKSSILKALVHALNMEGALYILCAPTGRAAKRITETTGEEAATIHRTLEYTNEGGHGHFARNHLNPLETGMIIVDEVSMIDLHLFHSLLKAIRPGTRLVLVGDVDQLPSVGAGDVLRDLIQAGIVPVTRLSTIFRQDRRSKIVTNAHAINNGQMPDTTNDSTDFFFFGAETPQEIGSLVVDIVANRLPARFAGLDPVWDVQLLTPMYKGEAGVDALNAGLQARLNPLAPGKDEYRTKFRTYRVGDKVMQLRNNYDKGVFNGDIGRIVTIDNTNKNLIVLMGDNQVWYDFPELDELTLAYAVTVHKAQGSEFPVVVMPVTTSHYILLRKNLLYTGVTRGKRTVVLVGSRRAIGIAVGNDQAEQRHSYLARRLEHAAASTQ